jgi:hypothetical protein
MTAMVTAIVTVVQLPGVITQIEPFLFLLYQPRWPRQVEPIVTVTCGSALHVVNVNTTFSRKYFIN